MSKRELYEKAIKNVSGADKIDIKSYVMALENKLKALDEFMQYFRKDETIQELEEWLDYRTSKEGIDLKDTCESNNCKELREELLEDETC